MGPKQKIVACIGISVIGTMVIMAIVSAIPGMFIPPRFFVVGIFCAASLSTPVCLLLTRQAAENQRLREQLEQRVAELALLAQIDGLTGLLTRNAFFDRAATLHDKSDIWFLLIDIDHFKKFNDDHGHQAGDAVLQAVGQAIREALGPDAICGRMGGEEFAICLSGCDGAQAKRRAEHVRAAIQALRVRAPSGRIVRATASIGLSAGDPAVPIEVSLHRADLAMYAAKTGGRNQVRLAA
ncbi:diguanylate cyclase (GGDEF)-like protein [Sphingobium xenophagum]|uniref:diguanylate cyclase n=1 Tax=Sphingobium xenophagum TaxID=121428 RepID=A0ABU1WXH5_SPHXE|nr:GGDEF domain-containing protein [Sphingobium xenophagum]MDR7154003.1 diguanylate cyclase (GGDEF)-like protein [Sphingobium xenophagum]